MTKKRKLLAKILNNQRNVSFNDIVTLVEAFGFYQSRVGGSHHVFEHPDIPELVNLQNQKGQAKSYQIRQFLTLLEQYNLTIKDAGEKE